MARIRAANARDGLRTVPNRKTTSYRNAAKSARDVWWRAIVIGIAGGLAYANSLTGPFIFDDHLTVLENTQIRQWWRLGTVLLPERELPTAGRPLVNLSFAINYALGGLNVFGYHIVNIACHLLCALLVFGIVRRTLELPRLKERFGSGALNLGFATALLWMVHPLNTEAVDYVTQRTELMMALFYLLTLYASIRASERHARGWYAAAVLSCFAGMGCKESMVTAPVAVLLYDSIFIFDSPRQAIAERWRFYAALFASWIVLAAVLRSGPRIHSAGFSSGASPWTYLLNQTVMICQYLRRSVWPHSLVLVYGWPLPLTVGQVLPYALAVTTLFALTLIALVREPRWGFLGAWFFLTLAPTSSIVPIATEVGAERRMYLPLIAIVVLAVVSVSFIRQARSAPGAIALALIAVLLSLGTFARNKEYASELALARTVVERHPTSVGHHMLANVLIQMGDHKGAMIELQQAVPGDPRAHYTLGSELLTQGNVRGAIDELEEFLREQPLLLEAVSARQLLGKALMQERRWSEAIEQERMVLTMNPTAAQRVDTEGLLGEAFYGAQKFEDAILHYREYLRWRPNDVAAVMRLGIASVAAERPEDALAAFRRAVEIEPANADAQRNLANALYYHQNYAEAAVHAQQAVALRPADADAHDLLGRCMALLGKFDEARLHFERSLQINPTHAEAREDLRKLTLITR